MTSEKPSIGCGAVVTACNILESIRSNAELESMLLECGLARYVPAEGSKSKTLLAVQRFAVENPDLDVQTDYGRRPIPIFLVEEAIRRFGRFADNSDFWCKLERYLNLDGYVLLKESGVFGGNIVTGLSVAMPQVAQLPKASSEVDILLAQFGFTVAQRHLGSAKESITQANWEAANGQCRTFLEALTDAIADTLYPSEATGMSNSLQKRRLLARNGFLSCQKHEFGDGPGQTFLPGLAKLLHSDGAHAGISTQHEAMFRLQLVVVTARWLLKRFERTEGVGA